VPCRLHHRSRKYSQSSCSHRRAYGKARRPAPPQRPAAPPASFLWPPHRCPCAHPFTQTASQAVEILEAHFGEEEDEDENLAPNVSGGGFSFGNMAAQQQQQPAFAF
jgi:hypothetical protein